MCKSGSINIMAKYNVLAKITPERIIGNAGDTGQYSTNHITNNHVY